jgi:hypothetical protein
MFRAIVILTAFAAFAQPTYGCSKRASVSTADFLFADVIIEAKIASYRLDRNKRLALVGLETLQTLRGFHKERWEAYVQSQFESDTLPQYDEGPRRVLVALRGHISATGEIGAAVIWEGCAGPLLLPTDTEPGRSIARNFEKLR